MRCAGQQCDPLDLSAARGWYEKAADVEGFLAEGVDREFEQLFEFQLAARLLFGARGALPRAPDPHDRAVVGNAKEMRNQPVSFR